MKPLILTFFFLLFQGVYAQSLKTKFLLAKEYFKAGDYVSAAHIFQEIYDRTEDTEVAYFLAESYRNIRNYKKADRYYRKVLRYEKEKYPLAYFYEGEVKKQLGDYKKAAKYFKRFYRKFKNLEDKYYIDKSKYEKQLCEKLMQPGYVQYDSSLKIKRLEQPVNLIQYSDYIAQEINDSLFLFTSYRPYNDTDTVNFKVALWAIYRGSLQLVDFSLNAKNFHLPNFYYYKPDSILYFTICDSFGCAIYKARFYDNFFDETSVERLPTIINFPPYNSTQPYVCSINGQKYLFFASDREGGKGKYDIWVAKIINGEFYDVENLGNEINSIDDDICPFYDTSASILYFSSRWHGSLGGFDIFSVRGVPGDWDKPINLGKPLNSQYDEVFFTISEKSAYFSSNRPEKKNNFICCNDIFSILLKTNREKILNKSKKEITQNILKELIPIKLYFDNDRPNPRSYDTTTDVNYFNAYNDYIKKKELFIKEYTSDLVGKEKEVAIESIEDFFEDSVVYNVNKLQYFIDLLEDLLSSGDTIQITIKGFASPLNDSKYNINLSKRRIQSVVNYLYSYKNGLLSKYMNNGQLIIKRNAFGESKAKKTVSDKLSDKRNSVYSPEASSERKVEMIAIKF